jgi:hypothetical protein
MITVWYYNTTEYTYRYTPAHLGKMYAEHFRNWQNFGSFKVDMPTMFEICWTR